jgi:hypothetical protein
VESCGAGLFEAQGKLKPGLYRCASARAAAN